MTFEEWWKQLKPAECDELKDYFRDAWLESAVAVYERQVRVEWLEERAIELREKVEKRAEKLL